MTPPAVGFDLRQLRQAMDASGEVIFLTDRDGTITFVNREFERLYGYTAAEVVGVATPRVLKGGALAPDYYQSFWERLLAGEVVRGEFLNRTKDGRLIHVEVSANPVRDDDGRLVGFLGVQRDVTARKEVEAALRDSEARYRTLAEAAHRTADTCERQNHLLGAIIENAPNGVAVLSGADFAHSVVNPVLLQLLPPKTPVTGRPFAEVWPSLADALIPVFRRVEATGSAERADVVWWRQADGDQVAEPAYLTFAVGPIHVAGHESASVLIIVMDTTARRQLEAQVQQAQKMEAVGRLAGGIAHEFNNLMTSVLGYAELVLGTLSANDPRRADLDQICAGAQAAASLTRQLLALRRPPGAAPEPLDMNGTLRRMEPAIRERAGERTEVSLGLAPGLRPIAVDADQLEQIVATLAANAGESMPDGGRLSIETASVTLTAAQHVQRRWMPPGDYVELSIRDTGAGMTAEVRSHLFEPFFTTKKFGDGRGLGLSMVYGIVKASRGFIAVTSQPGEGSTFTLYFPCAFGPQRQAARDDS